MPSFYTEADYEQSVMELFSGMNYEIVYGPDVERDLKSPLYDAVVDGQIHLLNPDLPEDAIADAMFKLHIFENGELVKRNECSWTICKTVFPCGIWQMVKNARPLPIWWIMPIPITTPSSPPINGHLWKTARNVPM